MNNERKNALARFKRATAAVENAYGGNFYAPLWHAGMMAKPPTPEMMTYYRLCARYREAKLAVEATRSNP